MSIVAELRKTIKYPTSLIVNGADSIGIELAKSLLEQGGYVIMIDYEDEFTEDMISELRNYDIFSFFDYSEITKLDDAIRRLDYVFYLNHSNENLEQDISSQEFLEFSKFLDEVLRITHKFEAKFLATTSIKAHQFLLANRELDIKFKPENEFHSAYTESETQRYTESLTHEYLQKTSLDGRIIRLGEVIGENTQVTNNTTIGRLIHEGITNESLTIYGDGLDGTYYVHILDAVYGIIKAQFSKNTRGEIYSLCYEYEISALSIAYKINEFSGNPKEILFSNDMETDLPLLRLYKPAPNLMRVGWKPRISFERALKQMYEFYERFMELSENEVGEIDEDMEVIEHKEKNESKLKSWLKWIFLIPENKDKIDIEEKEYGALGRLIKQRRDQNEGRKGSIVMANKDLYKKLKRNQSISSKEMVSVQVTSRFDNLMKKFDVLRYITIQQFITGLSIFIFLGFVYVYAFAPVIAFGSDMFLTFISMREVNEGVSSGNYEELSQKYSEIFKYTKDANHQISKLSYLDDYDFYRNFVSGFGDFFIGLELLTESSNDTLNGSKNVAEYINLFEPEVVYRSGNDSILNFENTQDLGETLSNIKSSIPIAEDGVDRMELGILQLEEVTIPTLNIENNLDYLNFIESTRSIKNKFGDYSVAGKYIPELTGYNSEHTILFLLVDNTYYLPAGGIPTSALVLTMKNGGIVNIELSKVDKDQLSFNSINQLIIDESNLLNPNFIDRQTIDIEDLFYIQEGDLYMDEITRLYTPKVGTNVDGVVVLDVNFLISLLEVSGEVEYEQIKFNSENLLINLDLLLKQDPENNEYKKELLTNIFGLSLEKILNSVEESFDVFYRKIVQGIEQKDIIFKFYDSKIPYSNLDSDNLNKATADFINIMPISDNQKGEKLEFPSIKVNVDVLINEDFSSRKTITIDYGNTNNLDALAVCLPLGVSNFVYDEATAINKIERISQFRTCIKFSAEDRRDISFSYDHVPVQNIGNDDFDYSVGLRKQMGINLEYDIEMESDTKELETPLEQGEIVNSSKIVFVGNLQKDQIFGVMVN